MMNVMIFSLNQAKLVIINENNTIYPTFFESSNVNSY